MGDYVLGACLFFGATILLFSFLQRWSPERSLRFSPLTTSRSREPAEHSGRAIARFGGFAALILLGSISYARGMIRSESPVAASAQAVTAFPQKLGDYKLQREWDETMATGQVVFHWAEYKNVRENGTVSIGVSPTLGAHDTLICHAARGDDWTWHGPLLLQSVAGSTSLSASLFNTGATQYLEAATVCSGSECGQTSTERSRFGFVYSHPAMRDLMTQSSARPIPILLRAEIADPAEDATEARADLTHRLATFVARANLAQFTSPYRQH